MHRPDPLVPPISDLDRLHAAILTTAIEGGVGYWAATATYSPGDFDLPGSSGRRPEPEELPVASLLPAVDGCVWFAARPVPEQPLATWADGEGVLHPVLLVNVDTVARGVREVVARGARSAAVGRFAAAVGEGEVEAAALLVDAALADLIVQVGAFGKQVYA